MNERRRYVEATKEERDQAPYENESRPSMRQNVEIDEESKGTSAITGRMKVNEDKEGSAPVINNYELINFLG